MPHSGRFPRVRTDSDPRIDDRFRGSAVDFCRSIRRQLDKKRHGFGETLDRFWHDVDEFGPIVGNRHASNR